jgi:hypothetical protein
MSVSKRSRDPICDVCGHCHVQGVKCAICGHVGKYIVPGGPNKPTAGFVPPVPPGPLDAPNLTPPWMQGITVAEFHACIEMFFSLLPQPQAALPEALSNLDQLKLVFETLPDYCPSDQCPSYVMGIPCRPVRRGARRVRAARARARSAVRRPARAPPAHRDNPANAASARSQMLRALQQITMNGVPIAPYVPLD